MLTFNLHIKNGALNSKPVFEAFDAGARRLGYKVYFNSNKGDINVIWSICWTGRMAPNRRIYENFRKPVIVLEVGALRRGELWKMGVGGISYGCFYQPVDSEKNRASKLGLHLQDISKNEDGPIVIACQNGNSGQWTNPAEQYTHIYSSLKQIRRATDRKIVIREHPRYPLKLKDLPHATVIQKPNRIPNTYDDYDFDINNAFAVISHSSNPGTLAAIQGVQVFTSPRSLAWPMSQSTLLDIEQEPKWYPRSREAWLNDIAYTEWTVKEIADGEPIFLLTDLLEPAIM